MRGSKNQLARPEEHTKDVKRRNTPDNALSSLAPFGQNSVLAINQKQRWCLPSNAPKEILTCVFP